MHKNSCKIDETEQEELFLILTLLGYSKTEIALKENSTSFLEYTQENYHKISYYCNRSLNKTIYMYTHSGIKGFSIGHMLTLLKGNAKCLQKNLK